MLLVLSAALVLVIGIVLVGGSMKALASARIVAFVLRLLFGLAFLGAGGVMLVFSAGLEGVRALTHEEVAARVKVTPTGPQHFDAAFTFADGRTETYAIAGDEIYIDAHILKWSPHLNALGLHTSYRLDRIGGRYHTVQQELVARRTIYPLSAPAIVDVVALRRRLPWPVGEVVDAEYGSATFVPVSGAADLEVRVSTSGLLIRPVFVR